MSKRNSGMKRLVLLQRKGFYRQVDKKLVSLGQVCKKALKK